MKRNLDTFWARIGISVDQAEVSSKIEKREKVSRFFFIYFLALIFFPALI